MHKLLLCKVLVYKFTAPNFQAILLGCLTSLHIAIFLLFAAAQNDDHKLGEAAALAPSDDSNAAIAAAMAAVVDEAGPIDENLFDGDDLEDLDEDLEQLTL